MEHKQNQCLPKQFKLCKLMCIHIVITGEYFYSFFEKEYIKLTHCQNKCKKNYELIRIHRKKQCIS